METQMTRTQDVVLADYREMPRARTRVDVDGDRAVYVDAKRTDVELALRQALAARHLAALILADPDDRHRLIVRVGGRGRVERDDPRPSADRAQVEAARAEERFRSLLRVAGRAAIPHARLIAAYGREVEA
jgi:hypothetical protein